MAFDVHLQVVDPGKSLLAHWAREMVLFGQVRCLVAFKSVFSLEDFATVTLEDLGAKVDVVVALQGRRVVEDISAGLTNIIFYLTVHVLLVLSQISRPRCLVVTKVATKCICVSVELQVPFQLLVGFQYFSTFFTFVSRACAILLVVLQHCFQFKTLAAAFALERLFAVLPRLVPCQNSFGLEPATAIPALIIFHIFFFWGTVQVEIDISQLGAHHVLKIEDVFWCDLSRSRSKTDVNSNLKP